jgi:hypothetical protein
MSMHFISSNYYFEVFEKVVYQIYYIYLYIYEIHVGF